MFMVCVCVAYAEEDVWVTQIAQAVRAEASTVKVTYAATIPLTEGVSIEKASEEARKNAFQKGVEIATQQYVSQDRLIEVQSIVDQKIYKRARNFILNFKSMNPKISENDYQVSIDMTLRLDDLRKALVENQILVVNYDVKILRLNHLTKVGQMQFIKDTLEQDLKQVRQLVETYQKRGELTLILETSSLASEVISVLHATQSSVEAPKFDVQETAQGTIEISFL